MDQIETALSKLTAKEQKQIERLIALIKAGKLANLEVKKLVGKQNIYRVRKGDLRIIFRKTKRSINILAIERRASTTYRNR